MRARALLLAALVVAAAAPGPAGGQVTATAEATWGRAVLSAAPVLSTVVAGVPFVTQEPLLCGAAAVEMALRHAGATGFWAHELSGLVRPAEGGIRTGDLARAVRARGWEVRAGRSDLRALVAELAGGRPVVVLLEEAEARYHYVVVVGVHEDEVIFHDPARAPHLRSSLAGFLGDWAAAGSWALAVVGRGAPAGDAAPAAPPAPAHPLLQQASEHFRASRFAEAAAAAAEAAEAAPHDERAWALLGTSRYLAGDPRGALDAWNRRGGPVVDLVTVSGLRRTRHAVVARGLLGIRPGEPLTAGRLDRARRRLGLLPSAEGTALRYEALPGGLAGVSATAIERPLLPRGMAGWAAFLLPAALRSELRVHLPSPTGAGEAGSLHVRWSRARRAVGGALDAPAALGLPGVQGVSLRAERERHAATPGSAAVVDSRVSARVRATDWATGWLRWGIEGGLDRWSGHARAGVLGLELEAITAGDALRGALLLEAGAGDGDAPRYVRWSVSAVGAPLPAASRWSLEMRALASGVGGRAPRLLRPGAGVGVARQGLLRAHPIERDGALSGATIGTSLLNGSVEVGRRLGGAASAGVAVAAFLDVARVSRPGAEALSAAARFADAGVGLRVSLPGGRLALDAAVGSDGARALSLGWRTAPHGIP